MSLFKQVRRFCSWFRRGYRTPLGSYRRLSLEQLESRLTPTTFIWTGGGGANTAWSDGANWSGGSAPTGLAANLEDLVFPNLVGTGPVHSVNDRHSVNGGPATFDSLSF